MKPGCISSLIKPSQAKPIMGIFQTGIQERTDLSVIIKLRSVWMSDQDKVDGKKRPHTEQLS